MYTKIVCFPTKSIFLDHYSLQEQRLNGSLQHPYIVYPHLPIEQNHNYLIDEEGTVRVRSLDF